MTQIYAHESRAEKRKKPFQEKKGEQRPGLGKKNKEMELYM